MHVIVIDKVKYKVMITGISFVNKMTNHGIYLTVGIEIKFVDKHHPLISTPCDCLQFFNIDSDAYLGISLLWIDKGKYAL